MNLTQKEQLNRTLATLNQALHPALNPKLNALTRGHLSALNQVVNPKLADRACRLRPSASLAHTGKLREPGNSPIGVTRVVPQGGRPLVVVVVAVVVIVVAAAAAAAAAGVVVVVVAAEIVVGSQKLSERTDVRSLLTSRFYR